MKKILLAIVIVLVVIQFFQIDKTNPTFDENQDFLKINNTPPEIAAIVKASCYDCHSNQTVYPWYSYVQPAGWFLKDHIDEGREELNFSIFGTYEAKRQAHKLDESAELIEKGAMPLESYLIIHKDASLTESQKTVLTDYFKGLQNQVKMTNNLTKNETEEHESEERD
ncbi:heme-binding domain-containing protein [Flavobacterium sp. NRK F10]|uniref:heme-binding domain-containing protein n=1 Tax=Flavobacterium sp. NRK F10 TaxID=2954931 RepID=UPI002091052E|nr:heme-binding domain-containing protein [Flavobacterium sp. NRK F10]MCO6175618.1 heme-binding domain-containing protein [Flavobacterium sp. NRK F10]